MIDIKLLRNNPEQIKRGLIAKNEKAALVDKILELDKNKREYQQKLEQISNEKNKFNKSISKLTPEEKKQKIQQLTDLTKSEEMLNDNLRQTTEILNKILLELPNLPKSDVKIGKDDTVNEIVKEVGKPTNFDFTPKDHLDIGEQLNIIDMKSAVKISGSRFSYLKNQAVQLEFAIIQYAINVLSKEGFQMIIPPVIVKDSTMQGLGYISGQGEQEMYHLTNDKQYLIGTAEHSLIPIHANEIIKKQTLPIRYAGYSTCFRREAGSYGKDTKGILRLHQFNKIEMVSFTLPEESDKEHDYLLSLSEKMVAGLDLPYRIVKMCTGDLAPPCARTYDIECWMPSENTYRETHSISTCTDYQARRLKIRYKSDDNKNKLVHTLNGTAFAIGRTLIAIIENYQQKNGFVKIPKVLQKYCGFKEIKNEK